MTLRDAKDWEGHEVSASAIGNPHTLLSSYGANPSIFQIGGSTLDRWLRQYRLTKDLRSMLNGSRAWKLDHGAIVDYVKNNNDSTLHEVAQHFGTVVSAIDYSVS